MSNLIHLNLNQPRNFLWAPEPHINPAWRIGTINQLIEVDFRTGLTSKHFSFAFNKLHEERRHLFGMLQPKYKHEYSLMSYTSYQGSRPKTGKNLKILIDLDLITTEIVKLQIEWKNFEKTNKHRKGA